MDKMEWSFIKMEKRPGPNSERQNAFILCEKERVDAAVWIRSILPLETTKVKHQIRFRPTETARFAVTCCADYVAPE